MKRLLLLALLLCGCGTTKTARVENGIKADLSVCKPEETEAVHVLLPQAADYAICLALNKSSTSACSAQENALKQAGTDTAIGCGLGLIQEADQKATAANAKAVTGSDAGNG